METVLAENVKKVRGRIAEALAKRGTDKLTGDEVTLIAVSKNHPAECISRVQALGVENVGENRVQEAQWKQEELGHQGKWHLIGHLQSNKAKPAVELFDLIESVDSVKLLKKLNKAAKDIDKVQQVLLQINIAREEQKSGFLPEDYENAIKELDRYSNIAVRGIMVIAPKTEDEALIHSVFAKGYDFFCELQEKRQGIDYLSMGMSGDFPIAIEEGANMVRVGTAIFGLRDYSK